MPVETISRYQIHSELGSGGMAVVYRADDPRFGREVAVKVLPPALSHTGQDFRARFEREAKIIAALEHSAIVPVYDFGEADGQLYFVMRLMRGGSLADRLGQGPLSVAEAALLLRRIASALDAAHAQGIVHRDVKPGNILFDQYGDAYLSDFGIVKLTQAAATLTGSNLIIGTPAYMSPEQGRGDPDIDGRSDIYSLGAVLFEMLTGRVPYEAETPTGQIIKHITDPIPNMLALRQDLPPGCQAIIERSMAKDKAARYPAAADMAAALERLAREDSGAAGGSDGAMLVEPLPSKGTLSRRPVIVLGLAGVSVLLLLAMAVWLPRLGAGPASPSATPPPTLTVTTSPLPTRTPGPALTVTPRSSASVPATSHPTATPTSLPRIVLSAASVNVRSGPGTSYAVIAVYAQGTELEVVGRSADGNWLAVHLLDGAQTGWIAANTARSTENLAFLPVVPAGSTPTLRPTTFVQESTARSTNTPPPTITPTPPPTATDTPPPPTNTLPPTPTETSGPTAYP